MHHLHDFFYILLHIDTYLNTFISTYGFWTYLALFAIIFCETGLVVTPFLPGDSLLFAAGSLAAQPDNPLHILLLFNLLFLASLAGNQVNYLLGRTFGPRVFKAKQSWLFNKEHLKNTHVFYEKHGGKTLLFARFIPIVRTFAPFIAGIGTMHWLTFSAYNLLGGFLWVGSLLSMGYFLGSIPLIKANFTLVIYTIVLVSLVPAFLTYLKGSQNH